MESSLIALSVIALSVALVASWTRRAAEIACAKKADKAFADRLAELRTASARLGATIAKLESLNARATSADRSASRDVRPLPVREMNAPKAPAKKAKRSR